MAPTFISCLRLSRMPPRHGERRSGTLGNTRRAFGRYLARVRRRLSRPAAWYVEPVLGERCRQRRRRPHLDARQSHAIGWGRVGPVLAVQVCRLLWRSSPPLASPSGASAGASAAVMRRRRAVVSADLFSAVPEPRDRGSGSPRCSASPGNSRGSWPCPRSGNRPGSSASPRAAAGREASSTYDDGDSRTD